MQQLGLSDTQSLSKQLPVRMFIKEETYHILIEQDIDMARGFYLEHDEVNMK